MPAKYKIITTSRNGMILLMLLVLQLVSNAGFAEALIPEKQHPVVAKVVTRLLSIHHYAHKPIDDAVSSELFDNYIKSLDPNHSFFLAPDITEFEENRLTLDDAIKSGDLLPAYDIFSIFVERVDSRLDYAVQKLNEGFDFSRDESYSPDRSEEPWLETEDALNEIWRKRLKNEALNLKLTGKEWDAIVSTLTKRYTNFQKRIGQNTSEDVFQTFMNSLTQIYDPHSNYMSPIVSDNFGIQMSLSLQGIGAQLTTETDYTKVVRVLPGGPADRSKQLWASDRIVGVGQGDDGEILDVIGMRLDDVVQKIRGKKGTIVRLEILPADELPGAPTKRISLTRDKIILKEREAKSDTLEFAHEGSQYKIGVLTIPTFYADLAAQQRGERDYKSTTRDTRLRLAELKQANINGLIIDLRKNSGGSLKEAVELTGLFIEEGAVVQVRDQNEKVQVLKDRDRAVVYDGPLAVLVSRRSASASEIFAAAIQDYDRGIVLGGQTFGKGTVQQLYGFNRFVRNIDAKLGQIKLTVAKFYRVAGGTTQHRGVSPDIVFPSILSEWGIGEDTEENSLPWDEIEPSDFNSWGLISQYLPELRIKTKQRMLADPEFEFIQENIQRYKEKKENKVVSLNEEKRKEKREKSEGERFVLKNKRRISRGKEPLVKGEKEPEDEEKDVVDPLLDESARVLADLLILSGPEYQGSAEVK